MTKMTMPPINRWSKDTTSYFICSKDKLLEGPLAKEVRVKFKKYIIVKGKSMN
jgi:hypothetical protein